jgi:hypothetical protein
MKAAPTPAAAVTAAATSTQLGVSGAIVEEDEEEEEEEGKEDDSGSGSDGCGGGRGGLFDPADVPQAFSHFSWVATNGHKLVVDLQARIKQASKHLYFPLTFAVTLPLGRLTGRVGCACMARRACGTPPTASS